MAHAVRAQHDARDEPRELRAGLVLDIRVQLAQLAGALRAEQHAEEVVDPDVHRLSRVPLEDEAHLLEAPRRAGAAEVDEVGRVHRERDRVLHDLAVASLQLLEHRVQRVERADGLVQLVHAAVLAGEEGRHVLVQHAQHLRRPLRVDAARVRRDVLADALQHRLRDDGARGVVAAHVERQLAVHGRQAPVPARLAHDELVQRAGHGP